MLVSLKNKNVIVTGASRGIGKAIAELLVDCGAKVAIQYNQNANRATRVKDKLGSKAQLFQCDFSDALEVNEFFNKVKQPNLWQSNK